MESEITVEHTLTVATPRLFKWSIGIFTGSSPFELSAPAEAANPVIASYDVADMPARFVADPFMVRRDGLWYLFFEAMDDLARRGAIALATSVDGLAWEYRSIVLSESFHLSYPYVFEWEGEYYMIPEALEPGTVRLYRARSFPYGWEHVADLIDEECADSSIVRHDGRWWLFTCTRPYSHDILRLFHADDLMGPWIEHPASPLVDGDATIARPAGRIIEYEGRLIRFSQDCTSCYGRQVRAFEIGQLDAASYRERECDGSPILGPSGAGWNGKCMHHIDAHQVDGRWIACVDGYALDEP
jgi:hypothetical protein